MELIIQRNIKLLAGRQCDNRDTPPVNSSQFGVDANILSCQPRSQSPLIQLAPGIFTQRAIRPGVEQANMQISQGRLRTVRVQGHELIAVQSAANAVITAATRCAAQTAPEKKPGHP